MNWKTSRNERHKYFNEEKLALGEKENTSALMNIAQEDDSIIFKLLKNLWLNNLQFIILKCSRFYLFITCLYFTFTVCSNLLKKRKNQFESKPSPWLLQFSLFSNPPYYSEPPSPRLLVFDIFSNHSPATIPHPLFITDL